MEEDNSPHRREQQQYWEGKAVIIQRAWRSALFRKQHWQEPMENRTLLQQEDTLLQSFPTTLAINSLVQDLSLCVHCTVSGASVWTAVAVVSSLVWACPL
ncbi:hypothetical protein AALO_G00206140 [Alosa alosa]|uniref:Uncharacterized protein n=1 Tax=Alosa alosa TaxID=278164 RepID=A0AAV6G8J5_9TELE|nr:hypothetical protein AALO_G00206140 [Alosa alosa]